jgi:hypothetical protein
MNKFNITEQDRLDLKRMINQTEDYVDNTHNIQKLKHSSLIREDIIKIEKLKRENSLLKENDQDNFLELCKEQCQFLFNHYTDIFNKVCKDLIDLSIMKNLLDVLHFIEIGKLDQQEGSIIVGKILKQLYLDSAVKTADALDKERATDNEVININIPEVKNISWRDYKKLNS